MKLLEYDYYTAMLEGRHRSGSVKMSRDGGGFDCAVELLCIRYGLRVDGRPISLAQATKISIIANISILRARLEATFSETMQRLLSYARKVGQDYVVRFVDVGIIDIVEYIMSLKFLAASSRGTYKQYIRVD